MGEVFHTTVSSRKNNIIQNMIHTEGHFQASAPTNTANKKAMLTHESTEDH